MLVLSRKPGQRIFIGDNIVITVVQARDGSLRLGIDAPKEVKILRDDLATHEPPTLTDMPLIDLSHLNLAVV
jgi:carbon storage regulator